MPAPERPPTARELSNHPVVQRAIQDAWIDSLPNDPQQRHEEGGWIYMNTLDGTIIVRRAPAGAQAELILENPPVVAASIVVGVFHTHPNPSSEGWISEPSDEDRQADDRDGVPDLILADDGIHFSGPDSRRGGLGGGPGFPL